MNKNEAIQAMREGNKITHEYFLPDEWITLRGNIIVMEKGQECWLAEFFRDRSGEGWECGWSLFLE